MTGSLKNLRTKNAKRMIHKTQAVMDNKQEESIQQPEQTKPLITHLSCHLNLFHCVKIISITFLTRKNQMYS